MRLLRALVSIVRAPVVAVRLLIVGVAVLVWILVVPVVELVRAGIERLGRKPRRGSDDAEIQDAPHIQVVSNPERPATAVARASGES